MPRGGRVAAVLLAVSLLSMVLNVNGALPELTSAFTRGGEAGVEAIRLLHGWAPRVVVALIAGAALGAAGAVLQQVLRNPIASPLTLGVAAGAQFSLSIVTLFFPGMLAVLAEPAAMAGGALALAVVIALASRRGLDPVTVVLAGLVVSLYFAALNAGLMLFFELDLDALAIWGAGALSQHGWWDAASLAPRVAAGLAVLAFMVRPLTIMTLQPDSARALGMNVGRTRLLALAVAVYLTAAVISEVGVIGFVGLAAPAVARLAGARTFGRRLVYAPAAGALLLLATDQLVQWLGNWTSTLLPTGAVTALLGAPLLLWLLYRVRSGAPSQAADAVAARPARFAGRVAAVASASALVVIVAAVVGRDSEGWRIDAISDVIENFPWRLPRVLAAASAGLLLALAGTILQRLMRNAMASPEVMGISGGALAGIVAVVYFAPAASYPLLSGAGTLGALATVVLLMAVARRGALAPERLLLAGVAVKAVFDSLTWLVAASGVPFWMRLLNWISGSTYGASWQAVVTGALFAAVLLPAALAAHRWLDLFALGDAHAQARGLDVRRARMLLLLVAAGATAAATLLVGPLSFVGLMAPHLARMLGFARARAQLPAACAVGAALMTFADWLGRTVVTPGEIPAGLAASCVGGLYFMYLLRRR